MPDFFPQSMDKTASNYQKYVLPALKLTYPKNNFFEIEGLTTDEVLKNFDTYAGMDAYMTDGINLRPIASRIQYSVPYRSFTIRFSRDSGAPTEFEKIDRAIKYGYARPYYHIQTYIVNENKVFIGIVRTKDLWFYINHYSPEIKRTGVKQHGQANFYVCYWDDLYKAGIEVIEIEMIDGNYKRFCKKIDFENNLPLADLRR